MAEELRDFDRHGKGTCKEAVRKGVERHMSDLGMIGLLQPGYIVRDRHEATGRGRGILG